MARVEPDWSGAEGGPRLKEEGIYLGEVGDAEVYTKDNGSVILKIIWKAPDFGVGLCHDYLVMKGGGVGIGTAKLKALGFDGGGFDTAELIGKRAWLRMHLEMYQDRENLKVATLFDPEFSCGYWSEADKPQGGHFPEPDPLDEEASDGSTPF